MVLGVKIMTALPSLVGFSLKLCHFDVTIAVNATWISCLYRYSLLLSQGAYFEASFSLAAHTKVSPILSCAMPHVQSVHSINLATIRTRRMRLHKLPGCPHSICPSAARSAGGRKAACMSQYQSNDWTRSELNGC